MLCRRSVVSRGTVGSVEEEEGVVEKCVAGGWGLARRVGGEAGWCDRRHGFEG